MTKALFFLLMIGVSVNSSAQTNPDPDTTGYKRAADGTEYKIYNTGKGTKLVTGDYMELNVVATYNDSILMSTYDEAMPQYGYYDTAQFPVPFKDIFLTLYSGDSIVMKISVDTMIAKGEAAPFLNKGGYIYQYYHVENIYATAKQVDSAKKIHVAEANLRIEQKQQLHIQQILTSNRTLIERDSKMIEAYLIQNNSKAIKGKMGTYVVIKKEGTGQQLTPAHIASVNYTGRSFSNKKVFDSNTDPAFEHLQPYEVNMSRLGSVILGWIDALAEMKKGTKATVYIPSSLGFGSEGRMPNINPNEILIFDMEVKDAMTIEQAIAKAEALGKHTPAPSKTTVAKKNKPAAGSKAVKPVSKSKPTTKKTGNK